MVASLNYWRYLSSDLILAVIFITSNVVFFGNISVLLSAVRY
uniref:Uncharacterized protein n=1 Tax=Anguilla anguilla TaxID=7936 RepID=A0A0E9WKP1_ANGAN